MSSPTQARESLLNSCFPDTEREEGAEKQGKTISATTVALQGAVTSAVLQCPFHSMEGGQGKALLCFTHTRKSHNS